MNYLLVGGPNHGQIIEQHNDNPSTPIRAIINTGLKYDPKDRMQQLLGDVQTVQYYPRKVILFNRVLRVAVFEDLKDPATVDILIMRLILRDRITDILEK